MQTSSKHRKPENPCGVRLFGYSILIHLYSICKRIEIQNDTNKTKLKQKQIKFLCQSVSKRAEAHTKDRKRKMSKTYFDGGEFPQFVGVHVRIVLHKVLIKILVAVQLVAYGQTPSFGFVHTDGHSLADGFR